MQTGTPHTPRPHALVFWGHFAGAEATLGVGLYTKVFFSSLRMHGASLGVCYLELCRNQVTSGWCMCLFTARDQERSLAALTWERQALSEGCMAGRKNMIRINGFLKKHLLLRPLCDTWNTSSSVEHRAIRHGVVWCFSASRAVGTGPQGRSPQGRARGLGRRRESSRGVSQAHAADHAQGRSHHEDRRAGGQGEGEAPAVGHAGIHHKSHAVLSSRLCPHRILDP